MSLFIIEPMSKVFMTHLDMRMFVGVVMILCYLTLVEMLHQHKKSDEMRKVFAPITLVMIILLVMILVRKLSAL